MANFLSHGLVPIAIGAVAIVLLLGLVNMMRGGSGNTSQNLMRLRVVLLLGFMNLARGGSPHRSQKLMRLRVLLQFIALVVIMLTIWIMGR